MAIDSGYVMEIHVEYEFLKYTDLVWLYSDVRSAMSEALKDPEVSSRLRGRRGRPRVIVESVITGESISIELAFDWARDVAALITLGTFAKKTFEVYLKKRREKHLPRKRRTRSNINLVRVRLRRRVEHRIMDEEEERWYEFQP